MSTHRADLRAQALETRAKRCLRPWCGVDRLCVDCAQALETRAALREGAREHAQYQQALPPQPTAPTWQEAHRPTLEELEAVCGGQEPRQAYGSREQEHAARIEALERRLASVEKRLRLRGM